MWWMLLGTVKVKAEFENKEMKLWPGAYVNVDFSVQTLKDALVVPRDAVIVNPKGSAVYIAGAEGKATETGASCDQQNDAVITGIEAARVVVDGKAESASGIADQERSESKDAKDKSGAKTVLKTAAKT
jgi:multidrug efflux pump subunit AcrA (membrane-fusion protein)